MDNWKKSIFPNLEFNEARIYRCLICQMIFLPEVPTGTIARHFGVEDIWEQGTVSRFRHLLEQKCISDGKHA